MSPICATFHRSCQSCTITQTGEIAQTAGPAEHAQTANPAPRSGRRKASLRDQNPGSEKKRGSEPAKKPAMSHPAFRTGLPRYRPQAVAAPGRRVPGVSDERPLLPKPKPRAPQSPCLQVPAILSQGLPRPADPALREPRCASTFLNMGWKSGQRFWRLERSEIKQKSVRHAYNKSYRICYGLLWCATGWPFFV